MIKNAGGEPDKALVTVPAYFSDVQLKAMKATLEMVGQGGLSTYEAGFAREPSAAAYSYMHDVVANPHDLKWVLVFDFGGGTVDVSILNQPSPDKLVVKGQSGNLFLGGEDLDDILVELVSNSLSDSSLW